MSRPIRTFKIGNCSASIFENEMTKGEKQFTVHSVSLQRSYQDKEGNWKNVSSYNVNDIPKARLALDQAYAFLMTRSEEEEDDPASPPQSSNGRENSPSRGNINGQQKNAIRKLLAQLGSDEDDIYSLLHDSQAQSIDELTFEEGATIIKELQKLT